MFLLRAGKLPARLGPQASASWRALRRLAPVVAVVATLGGCARGGGIGLEAMVADSTCEQQGFHLGTPEYANCRMAMANPAAINNAAMRDFYLRQAEIARQNQPQTYTYYGSNIGGITGRHDDVLVTSGTKPNATNRFQQAFQVVVQIPEFAHPRGL
jgi:hypothetical protein